MAFVPPTAGVFDAPAVSISLNVEWRSFVIGALESLLSSPVYGLNNAGVYDAHAAQVWTGDDDAQYAADQEIEKLLNALAKGNAMLPGMVQMYLGTIAPAGWLLCDGSVYEKIQYPALWGVLSLSGAYEEDADNFKTPDFRGRVPVGAGTTDEIETKTLGESGGLELVTLDMFSIPPHSHGIKLVSGTGTDYGFTSANQGEHIPGNYAQTTEDGSGAGHYNMQPYHVLNFIIKT